jgi:O-antigen/teichoic acid export membrane protein
MTDNGPPPPGATTQVTSRTIAASIWLIVSRFATKGVDFIALLVLARLLTPTDFGLVSIAMTFIFIIEAIFELPVTQVLVRTQSLDKTHFDTAFTLSALRGAVLMLTLAALAIPAAHFYGDTRIGPLMLMLSLAPAARGLQSPRMADNARRIFYRYDFYIEVLGKLAGFLAATTTAILTHSYWSIAFGTVVTPVIMMVASYILAPHTPTLSLSRWREFAGFLGWSSAAQLFNAVNWQCDRLILARYTSRPSLGAFTMANDLSYLPEQALIKPIQRPLLSAFSLIAHDQERLKAAYFRTVLMLLLAGMPAMICLSALARPIAIFALSAKWLPAVPILQILSLTLIPPLFTAPLGPLAVALGRNDIFLRLSLLEFFFKIPAVAIGAIFWGLQGVLLARIGSAIFMCIVSMGYVRYLIAISFGRQIKQILQVSLASLIFGCDLLFCRRFLESLLGLRLGMALVATCFSGLIVFIASYMLFWWLRGRPDGIESDVLKHASRLSSRLLR